METIFWLSLFIPFYAYLGYGIVLWVMVKFKEKQEQVPGKDAFFDDWPAATLVIAAYNEEKIIDEKIRNCRSLDYPEGKLHLVFVTDGSTDGSPERIAQHAGVQLLHHPERQGKMAAVKRAVDQVKTPITVFTDANTFLNPEAIKQLVAKFRDPAVGAVAGEKQVRASTEDPANVAGEGLYWRYESYLKKLDARLGSVVGAAGELYAIRTELFQKIPDDTILDDFCQTLGIAEEGFRVDYAPEARAIEFASAGMADEWKRKVRICAGGFQAIVFLKALLNPFKHGILTFQYVSHRVLRWTLAPLCLPVLLFSNSWLALHQGGFFLFMLLAQVSFYGLAAWGWLRREERPLFPGFFTPLYFAMMNSAVYAGFLRFLRRSQQVTWEKVQRLEVKGLES